GKAGRIYTANGDKPDVTATPIPRFDLLNREAYTHMCIQFSRGCPFACEFCDITTLYGKMPRTKLPEQIVAEMQAIFDTGFRGEVFLVDDNFI
ncbi:radical SAM protein, partial [Enterococcus faecium]